MADTAQLDMVVKLVDEATANLKKIRGEVSTLTKTTKESSNKMSAFSSTIRTGFIVLGSGIVLGAVKSLTGALIEQAGQFEQSQIAFGTMLGSMEKGTEMLRQLTDFAAKTPFTLPGVEASAKMLLAMGIEADNIIPTLKSLGDVSAGLSVPIDQLALAYGQVRAANQLMGSELRQFVQAGVPLIGTLAKQFGVTESKIKDMVEKGKVGFKDVEKAFKTMSGEGGTFFNLMDKQSQTFAGQVSNMSDNFTKLMRAFGEPLLEALKPLVGAINDFMNTITARIQEVGLKQWAEENATSLTVLGGIIGGVLLAAIVGIIAALVSFAGAAILVGVAFAALGGALAFFVKNIIDGWPAVILVWDLMKVKAIEIKDAIIAAFNGLWSSIQNIFNSIAVFFQAVWAGITQSAIFAVSLLVGLIVGYFEGMGINIIQVLTDFSLWLTEIWTSISTGTSTFMTSLQENWNAIWNAIVSFVQTKWGQIKDGFKTFTDGFSAILNPWLSLLSNAWNGMWDGMTEAAMSAWEIAKGIIKDSINWIINKVNKLIESINEVARKGAGVIGLGDKVPQMSTVPLLAKGGVVSAAGSAIVGEAGPELVSLPRGASVTPLGQGITIIINNPMVLSEDDIVEKIGNPLIRILQQHAAVA